MREPWIQALAGGLLLGFSFPPFPFPFLAAPGFALLLAADISGRSKPFGWLPAFSGLVVWNLVVAYWLLMATTGGGIASNLANAAVMFGALRGTGWFLKKGDGIWTKTTASAGFWTLFEAFHHYWDLAWPWLSLGNAYAGIPQSVQFYALTGVFGGTFLTAWAAGLIALTVLEKRAFELKILAPMLPFVLSMLWFPFITQAVSEKTIRVAVAQPNHDSYLPNSGFADASGPANALIELTETLLQNDRADVMLWPENGIDAMTYAGVRSVMIERLRDLVKATGTPLITGSTYYEPYKSTPAFITRASPSGTAYDIFNAAIQVDSTGVSRVYKKHHLVPIVERFPFAGFLLKPIASIVDVAPLLGFGIGRELVIFDVHGDSFPAFVCYDSVFPQSVRETVRMGAGFIAVITNDGWWGHSSGHIQHFAYARLRAIETGRYVVRSANNGISGVIAPDGSDVRRTRYWEKHGFVTDIPVLTKRTFFVKYGFWILWLCGALVVLSGIRIAAGFARAPLTLVH